jgi:transcription elongation factor GreA
VTKIDAQGKVIFGATVEIEDLETEKKVTYQKG